MIRYTLCIGINVFLISIWYFSAISVMIIFLYLPLLKCFRSSRSSDLTTTRYFSRSVSCSFSSCCFCVIDWAIFIDRKHCSFIWNNLQCSIVSSDHYSCELWSAEWDIVGEQWRDFINKWKFKRMSIKSSFDAFSNISWQYMYFVTVINVQ